MFGIGRGSLGELIVSIGTDLTKLDKGLKTASSRIGAASKRMSTQLNQIGRSMTLFGATTVAGFVAITIPAVKFEDAFAGVRKTVDASEEEFKNLEKNLLNLSKIIPTTATELAGIAEVAGQLGIRGVENITKFTKTIAQIEASTSLSADTASVSFARIANIMDEPISNIDKMGSSVVALGNNFAANESEIINFSTRIAGAGKIAKLATSDIFGIGTAFSAVGVNAEAGGTSVQKVLNAMTEAVATGSEELKVFADVVGMTTEEFQELYRADPSEIFTRFVEGLGAAGDESFEILKDLGMQNERVIRSFLSLAGAGDLLRRALETSGKAFKENTALQKEYDKRLKTTASKLKILKNNITYVAIELGDTLLPIINKLIKDYLIPVVTKLADWIEQNKELVKKIAFVTAAVGAFALVIGPLIILLGNVILVSGFVVSAILALISPLGLVVVAVGVFATAWYNNWGGIQEFMVGVARSIGGAIDSIQESLLKLTLYMSNISAIPLKERLLHPIESITKAWRDAEAAVVALKEEGEMGGFADAFEAGMQRGIDMTEEFKQKIQEFKDTFKGMLSEEETSALEEKLAERFEVFKQANQNEIGLSDKKFSVMANIKKYYDNVWIKAEKNKGETAWRLGKENYAKLKILLAQHAEDSKAAATMLKVTSIGEAIINTAKGVTEALALGPLGIPLAVIIGALGAIEIATIAGVQFAEGTDSVPANVHPGEMIIPNTFADAIRGGRLALSGPGGGVGKSISVYNTFEFSNITITDERDIEELAEELGDNIENKIRSM